MSVTLWIVLGSILWFVLAASAGPAEQERQSRVADPY